MSRVIVLSNRVNLPDTTKKGSAGGLAVAVFNALQQNSNMSEGIWLGWNGKVSEVETASQNLCDELVFDSYQKQKITYMTTAFSPKQYQHFYCGFANNVLWAFLHDRVDLIAEAENDFLVYQQVNALFAQQLHNIARPEDVIWVHDYHFFGVAAACRKLGMQNRIGFFLHIPFAPSAAWQNCPHAADLLNQLACYDVIGLQTQADKRHCLEVMMPILAKSASHLPIHTPMIDAYPIGVDVATIAQQAAQNNQHLVVMENTLKPLTEKLPIQIVAVDRIDYSKGILQRLQAFAQFLHTYPAYQGKVQLLQIAIPSRLDLPAYRELYAAVKQQVASINQSFATADWQPINYSESVLSHEALMSVFYDSHICWVNSLKDGMNLVAKEYIAAQNPANAGVLLLSKYAGASEQMTDALIIDPYDEKNVVEKMQMALTMSHTERQTRYQSLMVGLKQQDLSAWQTAFLQDLTKNTLKSAKIHVIDDLKG